MIGLVFFFFLSFSFGALSSTPERVKDHIDAKSIGDSEAPPMVDESLLVDSHAANSENNIPLGSSFQLDLGPVVIHEDGTMGRLKDWKNLTPHERLKILQVGRRTFDGVLSLKIFVVCRLFKQGIQREDRRYLKRKRKRRNCKFRPHPIRLKSAQRLRKVQAVQNRKVLTWTFP